jgi:hypothetical protein
MLTRELSLSIAEANAALTAPGQPFERVEAAVFEHLAVADCAVLGVPHETLSSIQEGISCIDDDGAAPSPTRAGLSTVGHDLCLWRSLAAALGRSSQCCRRFSAIGLALH